MFVSDVHLQPRPPAVRSCEPDWLAAQARPLREVAQVAKDGQGQVVYTGDIFTHPDPPVWFVNWAAEVLPPGWAVPGNHDLVNHRLDSLRRTGFWALVKMGVLQYLEPGKPAAAGGMVLHGFPYGTVPPAAPAAPADTSRQGLAQHVAVLHAYCWLGQKGFYPGVPRDAHASRWALRLRQAGYDVGFFGDQHAGFWVPALDREGVALVNCGTLMRRTVDEVAYRPAVGLLFQDGRVGMQYLTSCGADRFVDAAAARAVAATHNIDLSAFVAAAEGQAATRGVSFSEALEALLRDNSVPPPVAAILVEELQKAGVG